MADKILLGRDQKIHEIPAAMWKQHLAQVPQHSQSRLSFMTDTHHQVRYFVVEEMAKTQQPIEPEFISRELHLPLEQVNVILAELQEKLFFLVRNAAGTVIWAYPLTVESTPHRLTFAGGEHLYAAGAEDALAAPFVQGQLRQELVSIEVATSCQHCDRALHLTIDSNMGVSVHESGSNPLVFLPEIDWNNFAQETIIDSYGRNSVFFWSEEHAREYRRTTKQVDGVYLTLEQCANMIPITQGALFAFKGALDHPLPTD